MAISCGFFNSKGLDRTYTAEDFCDYLGSIICDGVQAPYGDCFALTTSGMTATIGTGKAWIKGHYFISNDKYAIDLKQYQDDALPKVISIGIVLDTAEAVRDVKFEVIAGDPADIPAVPDIPAGGTRTRLHLFSVRIRPGVAEIDPSDITDFRDDANRCGYCKCILGKCGVTELQARITELIAEIEDNNNRIEELSGKVDELTGDVVESGTCGDNINYVLFADGRLFLRGSGPMYDYNSPLSEPANNSPFYANKTIKSLAVATGITSIGNYAFRYCNNLESASFPNTLERIGDFAFFPDVDDTVPPSDMAELKTLTIPSGVTEIGNKVFIGSQFTELTVPATVTNMGTRVFEACPALTTVRYEAPTLSDFTFTSCPNLSSVTIAKTVTRIGSHWMNYCPLLKEIIYEGSLAEWNAIEKQSNWDANSGQNAQHGLDKVICTDGFMEYDRENKRWEVGEV